MTDHFFGMSHLPPWIGGWDYGPIEAVQPPPEPQPIEGEILAWRAWHLFEWGVDGSHDWRLRSLSHDCVWDGPALVADEVPTRRNEHGVYAHRTRHGEFIADKAVFGVVALSGRVVEHKDGYRAQRATIRRLYLRPPAVYNVPRYSDDERASMAEALRQRYQCDVKLVRWSRAQRQLWEAERRRVEALAKASQDLKRAMDAFVEACGYASAQAGRLAMDLAALRVDIQGEEKVGLLRVKDWTVRVDRQADDVFFYSGLPSMTVVGDPEQCITLTGVLIEP